jgi:hypothetical protein
MRGHLLTSAQRERQQLPSDHWRWKRVQELKPCLTSLSGVSFAHPGYTRSNEVGGFGGKKEAHGLARGKSGLGLQSQSIRGEVNRSAEVFSRVTLDHKRHSHLDPLAFRRTIYGSWVVEHAIRLHAERRKFNKCHWGTMRATGPQAFGKGSKAQALWCAGYETARTFITARCASSIAVT